MSSTSCVSIYRGILRLYSFFCISLKGHKTGILIYFPLVVKGIYNFMQILLSQSVLVTILDIAFTRIYHKDTFTALCILFIYHNNTGRNTCTIKQVSRQAYNAFYPFTLQYVLTNICFCISSKQYAMR